MKKQRKTIGPFLIVAIFLACTSNQNNSIIEQNKELILKMNQEVWNKGNLEIIEELYSADFVHHFLPDSSEFRGIDTLRERIRRHRIAFPDWKEKIIHIVAEQNFVVIHFESTGTNLGSWFGRPPTGNKVHINEFAILRVQNGKIAEQWLMPDIYNLREQLGRSNQ